MASTAAATPAADVPSATSVAPVTQTTAPAKCIWTEHTSPDGYKYYYNNATGESRVRIFFISSGWVLDFNVANAAYMNL